MPFLFFSWNISLGFKVFCTYDEHVCVNFYFDFLLQDEKDGKDGKENESKKYRNTFLAIKIKFVSYEIHDIMNFICVVYKVSNSFHQHE